MASPDFSQYIDLTPLDVDPANIYLGSIELARLTIPEFTLRQGTPEDAIFQAMSFMSGLTAGAINRLPSRLMVGLANLLGYARYEGTRATVQATLTLATFDAAVIPAGTILSWAYEEEDGELFQYAFELVDNVDIAAGVEPTLPTGTANLRSITPGFLPTLPVGTELSIVTTNTAILSAITTDTFSNGEDPETDEDYLNSVVTYVSSLSSSIATASQAEAAILTSFREVQRCKVYDLTDPTADLFLGDPAEPGFATVFVYGRSRQMTSSERSEIQIFLENKINASIIQDVLEFNLAGVSIRADVTYDSSYDETELSEFIEITLQKYLSPDLFPYSEIQVRASNVLSRIARLDGVLYVENVALQPIGNLFNEKQWVDVRVATTADVNISSGLEAGDTIDGVTLVAGDRILVKSQTDETENGIYIASSSGAASRSSDANEAAEFAPNKLVYVTHGTANGQTYWKQTTSGSVTVGVTNIEFAAGQAFQNLTFIYKGSLPDLSQGTVTLTMNAETIS